MFLLLLYLRIFRRRKLTFQLRQLRMKFRYPDMETIVVFLAFFIDAFGSNGNIRQLSMRSSAPLVAFVFLAGALL